MRKREMEILDKAAKEIEKIYKRKDLSKGEKEAIVKLLAPLILIGTILKLDKKKAKP